MRGCLLLLLTACRSDDEVEGRARALLEAARRAKAPEAPTEPVSLTVENLGVLRVDPGVDCDGEDRATFLPLILYSHSLVDAPSPRQTLLTGLACLWCARLGLFLGIRIFVRGSDWRFVKLMSGASYNFFGWVCQGSWIFLQGLCIWLAHLRE